MTNGIPLHADAIPLHADAIPLHADAIPLHADAIPLHGDAIPRNGESQPNPLSFGHFWAGTRPSSESDKREYALNFPASHRIGWIQQRGVLATSHTLPQLHPGSERSGINAARTEQVHLNSTVSRAALIRGSASQ